MPISTQTLLIEENHHPVLYAPEIQYPMHGSKVDTAYVAIPYVDQALNTFATSVTWDGSNWAMTTKFPDGWVPPILTESWSPALSKNYEVGEFALFQKELGFGGSGHAYTLPGVGDSIGMMDSGEGGGNGSTFEVALVYYVWGPSVYEDDVKAAGPYGGKFVYRIPIVSEQLSKFYFGSNWHRFYNYLINGKDNKVYTIGDRQVDTTYQQTGGTSTVMISYPEKTLNGTPLK
jgi:hypothetical protein